MHKGPCTGTMHKGPCTGTRGEDWTPGRTNAYQYSPRSFRGISIATTGLSTHINPDQGPIMAYQNPFLQTHKIGPLLNPLTATICAYGYLVRCKGTYQTVPIATRTCQSISIATKPLSMHINPDQTLINAYEFQSRLYQCISIPTKPLSINLNRYQQPINQSQSRPRLYQCISIPTKPLWSGINCPHRPVNQSQSLPRLYQCISIATKPLSINLNRYQQPINQSQSLPHAGAGGERGGGELVPEQGPGPGRGPCTRSVRLNWFNRTDRGRELQVGVGWLCWTPYGPS